LQSEPTAYERAADQRGGWVLIRSTKFDKPTADMAVGFLF
jgi:hypothetical protein